MGRINRIIKTIEKETGLKISYMQDFDSKTDKFRFEDATGRIIKVVKVSPFKIDDSDTGGLDKIARFIIKAKNGQKM